MAGVCIGAGGGAAQGGAADQGGDEPRAARAALDPDGRRDRHQVQPTEGHHEGAAGPGLRAVHGGPRGHLRLRQQGVHPRVRARQDDGRLAGNITSFFWSSCANNGKGALNTPVRHTETVL
eukprot:2068846-Pyramimonas_sp.AAC.2